jgi:hydroxymethylglutaryl-CoA lyase
MTAVGSGLHRPSVEIVEVSPRDGLQADPSDLTTEQKIELVRRLVDSGLRRIEATSFVNPKAVPKMADAEEVMAGVPRLAGVRYSVLAFNPRGVERALAAGVDEINGVIVATETFSQRNQNATVAESIARWRRIADEARRAGLRTSVTISASFGCAYEGEVPPATVVAIVERLAEIGMDELCLADTVGAAVPNRVTELVAAVRSVVGDLALRAHFHNTRNTAVANVAAGLDAGVFTFDSSLGGVGGCPFSPRATGNVATEDVVFMVERMGYRTGVSLAALIATTEWFEGVLGHGVPSLVAKAGPFPSPGQPR